VLQHGGHGQAVGGVQAHGFAQQVPCRRLDGRRDRKRARLNFLQQLWHVVYTNRRKENEEESANKRRHQFTDET
jgi:hypothetical protein